MTQTPRITEFSVSAYGKDDLFMYPDLEAGFEPDTATIYAEISGGRSMAVTLNRRGEVIATIYEGPHQDGEIIEQHAIGGDNILNSGE